MRVTARSIASRSGAPSRTTRRHESGRRNLRANAGIGPYPRFRAPRFSCAVRSARSNRPGAWQGYDGVDTGSRARRSVRRPKETVGIHVLDELETLGAPLRLSYITHRPSLTGVLARASSIATCMSRPSNSSGFQEIRDHARIVERWAVAIHSRGARTVVLEHAAYGRRGRRRQQPDRRDASPVSRSPDG